MRAAVIESPGRASVKTLQVPAPASREVRVRVEGCGVCGSDLALWLGQPWFSYPATPGAPGHEGWGRIDAVGDEVSGLHRDARVAFLSSRAYAQYALAPTDQLVPLPESSRDRPFPAESLGCAMNAFRRSDIRAGQTVAIVGAGFLGLLLVQLAHRAGARVIVISRRPFALDLARRFGVVATVRLDDPWHVAAEVRGLTRGEGAERVIEAAGTQAALDLSTELTAERGRLIIVGYHQDGARTVNMQLWNWRGLDVVNAHERAPGAYVQGMRDAIDAVESGRLDPWPLYTHAFALDELDHALDALRRRPGGFLKGLVIP